MPPRKKKATKKQKKSASSDPSAPPHQNNAGIASAGQAANIDTNEQEQKTGFMDLPTEIRLRIYAYVLGEDKPIRIVVHPLPMRLGNEIRRRPVAAEHIAEKTHRGSEWDRKAKKYIWPPTKYTSILYVDKQICAEAEPVLYGENAFIVATTTALKDFVQVIGERAQHVRHIIIEAKGFLQSNARSGLKALCTAGRLRKLEFAHYDFCGGLRERHSWQRRNTSYSLVQLAKDCKELALSLQRSYRKRGMVDDIPAIFGLHEGDECFWCALPPDNRRWAFGGYTLANHPRALMGREGRQCGCECSKVQQNTATMQNSLREEIAKLLEPTEETA